MPDFHRVDDELDILKAGAHALAYPTLVTMLQGLIREAELAAIDLKPRRAVPLRAKARRARDLLHELGEVSE